MHQCLCYAGHMMSRLPEMVHLALRARLTKESRAIALIKAMALDV